MKKTVKHFYSINTDSWTVSRGAGTPGVDRWRLGWEDALHVWDGKCDSIDKRCIWVGVEVEWEE